MKWLGKLSGDVIDFASSSAADILDDVVLRTEVGFNFIINSDPENVASLPKFYASELDKARVDLIKLNRFVSTLADNVNDLNTLYTKAKEVLDHEKARSSALP